MNPPILPWLRQDAEHRQTKTRCENVPLPFPEAMWYFGQTFAELQDKRHLVCYDPDHPIRMFDLIVDIKSARRAIDRFLVTPAGVRRGFALHVLMRVRADA